MLEPVDADYRPTPPGELSHTVLISNLANRVQPFLRYDLGDRVLLRPDPCPCGSPLPAVRVQLAAGADPEHVWREVHRELDQLLTDSKLDHITVQRADEPPRQTAGGKYRTVIPLG